MHEQQELTDDELEELLIQQAKQQPAKCKMKPAARHINLSKIGSNSKSK